MLLLKKIHIILVEPSHMGNIGAVARSMYNMGITNLTIVNPKKKPDDESYTRASGAACILDQAKIVDNLIDALDGIDYLIGTSARTRKIGLPLNTIKDSCELGLNKLKSEQVKTIGVLFGRERTGLYNDELLRCHIQAYIPTNDDYSSLNLAQAVQVAAYQFKISYDKLIGSSGLPNLPENEIASTQQLEGLYNHLQEMLIKTEFMDPNNPGLVMERFKRIFQRSELDNTEVNLLRGVFSEAIRSSDRS